MSAGVSFTRAAERGRTIPSLDGLRALAVGAVILSHNGWAYSVGPGMRRYMLIALGQGGLGVNAFFIISGLLITSLLLIESDRAGQTNLKRFYFRRTLRIFPPYYVYLAIAAVVASSASRPIPSVALVTATTYTSNYFPYAWIHPFLPSWYVDHTWSLAVEEQFYLFWPLLFARMSRTSCIRLCIAAILLTPVLRLLTVLYLPVYGTAEQWFRLFHTDADALALGCLLAFLLRNPATRRKLERSFHPLLAVFAGCFLILCASLFTHQASWISGAFTISAANLCLAYLIVYAVLRPGTGLANALNWRPLKHIGLISYSLYLWQQLFLGPYAFFGWFGNCVMLFVCAELSFWLIERPSLRIRSKLEARFFSDDPQPQASQIA